MKNNKESKPYACFPVEQRPREKLNMSGAASLSDRELLAVILNTGIRGKNVKELAGDLLGLLDGNKDVPSVREISLLPGLGQSKACAVAAMLEFGRRRYGSFSARIKSPSDIFTLVRHYADRKQERFISLSLNGAHEVLAVRIVTIGLVNKTIVHPREVFDDFISYFGNEYHLWELIGVIYCMANKKSGFRAIVYPFAYIVCYRFVDRFVDTSGAML